MTTDGMPRPTPEGDADFLRKALERADEELERARTIAGLALESAWNLADTVCSEFCGHAANPSGDRSQALHADHAPLVSLQEWLDGWRCLECGDWNRAGEGDCYRCGAGKGNG